MKEANSSANSYDDLNLTRILIDAYETDHVCNEDKLRENIVYWSLWFVYIGVFNFIAYPTFAYMFGKAGEELTSRLRYQSFNVNILFSND